MALVRVVALGFLAAATTGRAQAGDSSAVGGPSNPGSGETGPSMPVPSATLTLHSDEPSPETRLGPPENSGTPGGFHFFLPEGDPEALPFHLLVVYNSTDPSSHRLATYYAQQRDIDDDHVVGIPCSDNEEITRAEYEKTVREPIISYIYGHGWMTRRSVPVRLGGQPAQLLIATHNDIWAMVLMRGVPLKIAQDNTVTLSGLQPEPLLQTNAAAVDSELSLLPVFGLPSNGFIPNAFFDKDATGIVRVGPELATRLILVTRLDGPTPADVRRMIDDSIYAEKHRLAGLAVIDSRGLNDVKNPYTLADVWLRRSGDLLAHDGWLVKLDATEAVLPPSDPCNQVAFYLGWYHYGAYGPWVTPPNRFVRGAVAYHLHSYSACSVRDPSQGWVAPLIAHGAAASMGTVYEPFLDLTPHLHIFTERLLAGNYFAEAAYAAQPGLSWMTTVVGDPLYRPFLVPLDDALADSGGPDNDHHDWLLIQKTQRAIAAGQLPPTARSLEEMLDVPGAVAQEALGDLLDELHDPDATTAAETAYRNAAGLEQQPIDSIRVGLKLAQAYANNGQGDQAQSELKSLRDLYPNLATQFGVADDLVPTGTANPVTPVAAPASEPAPAISPASIFPEQPALPTPASPTNTP